MNIFTKVKKWYKSAGIKGGVGLLAMSLGLLGVGITADDISYLIASVPAAITAAITLSTRVMQYSKGLGIGGITALIVGIISGGAMVIPPDILESYGVVQNYFIGISQILLTLYGANGIHRATEKIG